MKIISYLCSHEELLAIKNQRDEALALRNEAEAKVLVLENELLAMKSERDDALQKKKEVETEVLAMRKEHNDVLEVKDKNVAKVLALEGEKEKILLGKDEIVVKEKETRKKYTDLTSLLRSNIECPVCMEVPTSGPVPECPNGHIICRKCKRTNCPYCRFRIGDGKSLLAVTCLLYTSPSPRDGLLSRMPSSA